MEPTTYTVRVAPDKAGARLDRVLAAALPEISRSRLKALILAGRVRAGGGEAAEDPAERVHAGQVYEVSAPAPAPAPVAQAMPLDIVFEDDDVIVVDKPPGLVVHPGAGNPDRTLVNALLAHAGRLSAIGGAGRPGIVHRLDKDTSGLMVAAKTDLAHLSLARQFAAHSVERGYQALVWGVPRQRQGRIIGNIGRDPLHRQRMAVVARGGKPAATRYRVLEAFADVAALIDCRPETGRTHQIRVHLSSLGHPLVGDAVYGGGQRRARSLAEPLASAFLRLRRHALHAFLIGFLHPRSAERLRFEVDLHIDIKELVCILKAI